MIIKPAERVGTVREYYFSTKLKELAELKANGHDIINLGIGSPDLPPAQEVLDSMSQYIQRADLHGYQSYIGRSELRQAFAEWYQKWYGVTLNSLHEVLPLMGSKEGIMHIHMAFVNPGDQVLIPNPGYPTYAASARLAGAEIRTYDLHPEGNWQPDFEQLETINWEKVKIMWLNYPHMPTGAQGSPETFSKLIRMAHEKKFLICHDNPYSFILNDHPRSIMSVPEAKQVCLELNSLSKSHNLAGWRIGCLVGHAEYLQQVLKFKSNMDSGMMASAQLAAVEALQLEAGWYQQLNEIYRRRKAIAQKIFDQLGCQYDEDSVGMFVWGRIPEDLADSFSYSDTILKKSDVFITPGGIFGSNGNRYLRISLCQDIDVLNTAAQRIGTLQTISTNS